MDLLKAARLRSLPLAGGISVVVHSALVAAAVLVPLQNPRVDPPELVMIDIVAEVAPPPEPLPSPVAPTPVTPRAPERTLRRAAMTPPQPQRPAAEPPPAVETTAAPPEVAAPAAEPGESYGQTVMVATAPGGGGGATATGAAATGAGGPPGALSEPQRNAQIAQYRELMRGRIRDGFRYPPEARELELAGLVVVQVTVDRSGHLTAARLRGRCPHALLCDHALRTIHAAAPFSPIPGDLGDSLQMEVPLNYSFE